MKYLYLETSVLNLPNDALFIVSQRGDKGLLHESLCIVSQVREEMALVCHSGPCVL